MDIHLEVPEELARQLASDSQDLARVALEALAANLGANYTLGR